MKKFVWANKKGGVGKTTGSCNLAGALAELGYKVLAVDMDPQANLTYVFLGTRTPKVSIYDILVDQDGKLSVTDAIVSTQVQNVDILPSHNQTMDGAEREFSGLLGEQTLLSNRLQELDAGRYDYVVIDSPPNLGILTVNSITAADAVIIPVTPGIFALQGIQDLMRIINLVKRHLHRRDLKVAGFVLNEVEHTRMAKDVLAQLQEAFGEAVMNTQIPKNVTLEEAHSRLGTVFQYSPKSRGAEAYLQLAKEVIHHE